jgi:hypothetical protein
MKLLSISKSRKDHNGWPFVEGYHTFQIPVNQTGAHTEDDHDISSTIPTIKISCRSAGEGMADGSSSNS